MPAISTRLLYSEFAGSLGLYKSEHSGEFARSLGPYRREPDARDNATEKTRCHIECQRMSKENVKIKENVEDDNHKIFQIECQARCRIGMRDCIPKSILIFTK